MLEISFAMGLKERGMFAHRESREQDVIERTVRCPDGKSVLPYMVELSSFL